MEPGSESTNEAEASNSPEAKVLGLNKVVVLKHNKKEGKVSTVYIVGTAHISKNSCDKVREVVQSVKPDAVFLELCESRKSMLQDMKDIRVPTANELMRNMLEGKTALFEALYSWMLSKYGSELEVFPGEEFRVAFVEAQKIRAKVILGDRPVQTTIARMWAGLSSWQKFKLCWQLAITGINPNMDEMNKLFDEWAESDAMTEAIKELSRAFPSLAKHLITERDLYMVYTIRQLANVANVVVAVVGAGHLPGISENWDKEIDIVELSSLPPKKPRTPLWQYGVWLTGSAAIISIIMMRIKSRR